VGRLFGKKSLAKPVAPAVFGHIVPPHEKQVFVGDPGAALPSPVPSSQMSWLDVIPCLAEPGELYSTYAK
jgi:hypothetical protein